MIDKGRCRQLRRHVEDHLVEGWHSCCPTNCGQQFVLPRVGQWNQAVELLHCEHEPVNWHVVFHSKQVELVWFQGCWICDLTCCEALHHLQAHLLQCDAQLDIVVDWSTSLGDVDQLHGVGRVFSVDLGAVWPEVAAVKALCCQQKMLTQNLHKNQVNMLNSGTVETRKRSKRHVVLHEDIVDTYGLNHVVHLC